METAPVTATAQHDVTVVIPVYNVEKYLRQCIDSVIHQTYHYIDIILVDDGSIDSSGRICDEYSDIDPRITVIHKPNGGLSDARNAGLAQAHTKYVYFLDSDDYIEPQTLEILRGICEQNSLDMLSFDVNEIIDEGGGYTESYDYWLAKGSYSDVLSGSELFVQLTKNRDYKSPLQVHFFSRNFLEHNSLTFRKGIIHEDELFTFTALLHAQKAMHIPARLYDRRMRPDSIMSKPRTQLNSDSMYEILREILDKHRRFHDDPKTREAFGLGIAHLAEGYTGRYLAAKDLQNEKERSQFSGMMKELASLGYDTSGYVRSVNPPLSSRVKSAVRKIPGAKPVFSFAKRTVNDIIHHFRPPIDDECKSILARLKETNTPGIKRIITLCVPRHGNRGDIAISLAQRKLFTEKCPGHVLVEIPGELCRNYPGLIVSSLNTRDILITNGGGYFGSLWRFEELLELNILRHFPNNRIIIMPQTWYYSDDEQGREELEYDRKAFSVFSDLHVFARDKNSFSLIKRGNIYPNARTIEHVPDMVCCMDCRDIASVKRSGVLVCFRPDPEQALANRQQNDIYASLIRDFGHVGFFSTNPAQSAVRIHDWDKALDELLRKIAAAELVVTDRLHGMLFAAITGTPCIAFDNLTGKVRSVHEWIAGCEYVRMCGAEDDFTETVKKAVSSPNVWDNSGLLPYFSKITSLITEKE